MGLDMYLTKAKRLGNATAEEVSTIEKYFSYIDRGEEYAAETMEEWCDTKESDVPLHLVELYKSEYVPQYSRWDTEKKFPRKKIFKDVGYWRKANAIHYWFVINTQGGVDECQLTEVTRGQLIELREMCLEALLYREFADQILPTHNGFFFGGTDYDDWYFSSLEDTVEIIDKLLETTDFNTEMVVYQASW